MVSMRRDSGIDVLRLILALMVVYLHALIQSGVSGLHDHLLVNGLLRIAVPVFFVINGFYLAGTIQTPDSFHRWFKKIVYMCAFWMILYLPYYFPRQLPLEETVVKLVTTVLTGYYHLWYLPGLLGGSLLMYVMRRTSSSVLFITAGGLYLLGTCFQYFFYFSHIFVPSEMFRNLLFFSFPFIAAGLLIRRNVPDHLVGSGVWIFLVLGFAGLLAESYFAYVYRGASYFGFDMLFSLMLVSPALFVIARRYSLMIDTRHLSKLSTAIFFMHPFFLKTGARFAGIETGPALFVFSAIGCLIGYYPVYLIWKRLKFIL